jgi:Na+/proline symporter
MSRVLLPHPSTDTKGNVMGKKITLMIVSAVITLFFLAVSASQFWQAYIGQLWKNSTTPTNALIAGWISLILALLGACCLLLIAKSDPTHL